MNSLPAQRRHGVGERSRTSGLRIKNPMLFQLSYTDIYWLLQPALHSLVFKLLRSIVKNGGTI